MSIEDVNRVAVLGAGAMGHGIAEVCAIAGYRVTMRDVDEEIVEDGYGDISWSLDKLAEKGRLDEEPAAILERIDTTVDLESAVEDAHLVIEAAPENLDLKREIFADLERYAPADAVLASNTSSLPITDVAAATDSPERVCGLHFFNPPVKMDLVEVIYGAETTDDTAETAYAFVESIGKTPIWVRKDVRGFVVNSVLGPFGGEAMWMVSDGEATVREVDAAMVHQRGYPMGPFELADMTGIDVGYHVRKEGGTPIPPVMEEKVDAGELGRKTGSGFYEYEEGGATEPPQDGGGEAAGAGADYEPGDGEGFDTLRIEAMMVNEAAKLVGDDVATPEDVDTGVQLGLGFPEGICRRGDQLGLDAVLEKIESLQSEYGDDHGEGRYEPAASLVERVEAGKTGEDAGVGFYEYGGDDDREYHAIDADLRDDGVLEIVLDRPERLNALNRALLEEVEHALDTADLEEVRCVTFEGAGDRAFSAGADVTEFGGVEPHELDVSSAHESVAAFPRPTLAKIDGYCLGGGHELALACDLRVATTDSEFGFPEINLGLLPGGGGTQRAIRMLGDARAKELVFRGNRIPAELAEEWGLINRAVDPEEFDDVVEEFVDDLVTGPPIALEKAKQVMNDGTDENLAAGLRMESQAFGLLLTTEDVEEGAAAFMEDREPEFEGR